ncbi:MAG: PilN domain-containing protein [Gammaproteobacteria bacterium]|nr:PilN domain-containing protein [Gammaproteobacteria bacterium]
MYQQEINLYQPRLRKSTDRFSGKNILNISGIVLAGLLLMYGVFFWQVAGIRGELEMLQAKQIQTTNRLTEVSQKFRPKRKSAALELQVKASHVEVDIKRKILATIQNIPPVSTKGFAAFLEGMARQRVNGLWLTGFEISDGGNEMNISGRSLDPVLVPAYLKKLSGEQIFQGVSFEAFSMNRAEKEVAMIDFTLLANGQSGVQ